MNNELVKGVMEIKDPEFNKWFKKAAEQNMKVLEQLLKRENCKLAIGELYGSS